MEEGKIKFASDFLQRDFLSQENGAVPTKFQAQNVQKYGQFVTQVQR